MGSVRPTAPQMLRVMVAIIVVLLTSLLATGASVGATEGLTGYGGTTGPSGTPPSSPSPPSGVVTGPASGVLASAHVASPIVACVARSTYMATVAGSGIASATFILDGHKVKTVTHSPFSARIKLQTGRTHHLAIRVAFVPATGAAARTLHQTLARCATNGSRVGARAEPRFTG